MTYPSKYNGSAGWTSSAFSSTPNNSNGNSSSNNGSGNNSSNSSAANDGTSNSSSNSISSNSNSNSMNLSADERLSAVPPSPFAQMFLHSPSVANALAFSPSFITNPPYMNATLPPAGSRMSRAALLSIIQEAVAITSESDDDMGSDFDHEGLPSRRRTSQQQQEQDEESRQQSSSRRRRPPTRHQDSPKRRRRSFEGDDEHRQ